MPATSIHQFFALDPYRPPAAGTPVAPVRGTLTDATGDGRIEVGTGDTLDGAAITDSYPGDTVTIDVPGVGPVTCTGVTLHLETGAGMFAAVDGQVLQAGTFLGSTSQTTPGPLVLPGRPGPACVTPGTLILTPRGERAVEDLRAGDLVVTKDHGAQPVLRAGTVTVAGVGAFAPVLIRAGAFGNRRDLLVSPEQRMLVCGWRAELFAGVPEVLVAAAHLVDGATVVCAPCAAVTLVYVILARHEIVFAEGAETESRDPADGAVRGLAPMPGAGPAGEGLHVRPTATEWEGRAIAGGRMAPVDSGQALPSGDAAPRRDGQAVGMTRAAC